MSCLSLVEVDDYLEKEIAPEKAKSVEEHLLVCPDCRAAVANRRRFLEACSRLPDLPLPLNWAKTVMAKILSVGPTLPILILAAIAGLSFLFSSFRFLLGSLRPETSAPAFEFRLPLLGLVKSALLLLVKAAVAVTSGFRTFLRPDRFSFPGTGWPFSVLTLELAAGLFMAAVVFVFLLAYYYRLGLTREKKVSG